MVLLRVERKSIGFVWFCLRPAKKQQFYNGFAYGPTKRHWFYTGVASEPKKNTGFTIFLLSAKRKTIFLMWFCMGSNEKALVLHWFCLGSNEKALVLQWSCLRIFRNHKTNVGFIFKIARDPPGNPKSIGFKVVLRKNKLEIMKQAFALYTTLPGKPRDIPGHGFDDGVP